MTIPAYDTSLQKRLACWHELNSSVARAANVNATSVAQSPPSIITVPRAPSATKKVDQRVLNSSLVETANADAIVVQSPPSTSIITVSRTLSATKRVDQRLLNRAQRALVRALMGTWKQKPHEVRELSKWQVSDTTLRKAARNAYAALDKDNEQLDAGLLVAVNAEKKLKLPKGITYATIVTKIIAGRKYVPKRAAGPPPANCNVDSAPGHASGVGEQSHIGGHHSAAHQNNSASVAGPSRPSNYDIQHESIYNGRPVSHGCLIACQEGAGPLGAGASHSAAGLQRCTR
ncbi:hypothetical protein C8R43DRAFT_1132321 [Mycena crocata]|nr:hypothetical protein C8R43DRAFT_1132321 [Mycena crocata]